MIDDLWIDGVWTARWAVERRLYMPVQSSLIELIQQSILLGAAIQFGHDEFTVSERFRVGEAAIGGANNQFNQLVAGFVHGHLAAQNRGDVLVNVLAHRRAGEGIAGDFDDRLNRVADDVALAGREQMHHRARRRPQGHRFRRSRRSIHEPKALSFGRFGGLEAAHEFGFSAELLDIAQRLFFNRRQSAANVAFGRLRFGKVVWFFP